MRAASAAAICCAVIDASGEADAPGSPAAATITSPRMPPSAWPGTEQMKVRPPAGIVTSPVATVWASAEILVPSAKVRSWSTPPSLVNVTAYVPGASTCTMAGSKPRSKARTSMVPIGPLGAAAEADGEAWLVSSTRRAEHEGGKDHDQREHGSGGGEGDPEGERTGHASLRGGAS